MMPALNWFHQLTVNMVIFSLVWFKIYAHQGDGCLDTPANTASAQKKIEQKQRKLSFFSEVRLQK